MSERFVKYIPNEDSSWLRQNHPSVFLLLSLAIERARWTNKECPLGLRQGDAILGDPKQAGISPKQYANAVKKGIDLGIWEKVYSRRDPCLNKGQKRTIKGTIKCLVINIKNSMFWDLNFQQEDKQEDKQGTNKGQQTKNDKNEKELSLRKRNEKEKESVPPISSPSFDSSKIAVFRSPLSEEQKLKEIIEGFLAYCDLNELKLTEKDFRSWMKKYDQNTIMKHLSCLITRINRTELPVIRIHGAFMNNSLNEQYIEDKELRDENKKIVEQFRNDHKCQWLKMLVDYFVDTTSGDQFHYTLPNIKEILLHCLKRNENYG